jgi:hypothetical protein
MQIGDIVLTEEYAGSKVTFIPDYAKNDSSLWEGGTIAYWNDTYVFVNYGTGTNKATRPQDLVWG